MIFFMCYKSCSSISMPDIMDDELFNLLLVFFRKFFQDDHFDKYIKAKKKPSSFPTIMLWKEKFKALLKLEIRYINSLTLDIESYMDEHKTNNFNCPLIYSPLTSSQSVFSSTKNIWYIMIKLKSYVLDQI